MIGYLEGTILAHESNKILLKVGGVGYWVQVSEGLRTRLGAAGGEASVFAFQILNPRDGSMHLFGFGNLGELQFFQLLTSVSGIGPKSAQAILEGSDTHTLASAILNENQEVLSGLPGVGPKTAKRLIMELRSKVEKMPILAQDDSRLSADAEVVAALVALGYSGFEARQALHEVPHDLSIEQRISRALKNMAK